MLCSLVYRASAVLGREAGRPANHGNGGFPQTYDISSVEKLTMVPMKFSRTMILRMAFQSGAFSPSSRQIDSSAFFTAAGGLAMDLTSTRWCFLMDLTAVNQERGAGEGGEEAGGWDEHKKERKEEHYGDKPNIYTRFNLPTT